MESVVAKCVVDSQVGVEMFLCHDKVYVASI